MRSRILMLKLLATVSVGFCLALTEARPCRADSFQGLGFLPGSNISIARGVSADGTTVAGGAVIQLGQGGQAWRWSASTGMVGLGFILPSEPFSVATAVNKDGSVIVGIGEPQGGPYEAFRWTASTGMVGLGVLPNPGVLVGPIGSIGYGVNADGSVVVGIGTGGEFTQAFRWTASTGMTSIGFVYNYVSTPVSVSADGSAVVSTDENGQVFRWTAASGMVGLGCFVVGTCQANGVSANGKVIVGEADNVGAFRWTQETGFTDLGQAPGGQVGCCSGANAANADGSIVVGGTQYVSGGPRLPFIWTAAHGMQLLQNVLAAAGVDTAGWTLASATGISADGTTIVGDGTDPSGRTQAWIAHIHADFCIMLLSTSLEANRCRASLYGYEN